MAWAFFVIHVPAVRYIFFKPQRFPKPLRFEKGYRSHQGYKANHLNKNQNSERK